MTLRKGHILALSLAALLAGASTQAAAFRAAPDTPGLEEGSRSHGFKPPKPRRLPPNPCRRICRLGG